MQLFADPLHDEFASGALGFMPYGGPSTGELRALGDAVGDGDDDAFYRAFVAAADRLVASADEKERRGHRATAGARLLRAACLYGLAYKPLYGTPVDPRLAVAFAKQMEAFESALPFLGPHEVLRIPYEDTTLPAYYFPAVNSSGAARPLLVFTNGFDSNVVDAYLATAVAARRREQSVLIFDGPGQGELLMKQGIPMRPDWENVVGPVLDVAVTLPGVDASRIVLSGWSLGGYLSPRAASGDARIAACVADPGLPTVLAMLGRLVAALGLPADADPTNLTADQLATMTTAIERDRKQRWALIQRGFWVWGAAGLGDFLRRAAQYTLAGRIGSIACPILVTAAENDPLSATAEAFYEQVAAPKTFVRFKAADGAGDHCEMQNRPLLNETVFDWIDETFSAAR